MHEMEGVLYEGIYDRGERKIQSCQNGDHMYILADGVNDDVVWKKEGHFPKMEVQVLLPYQLNGETTFDVKNDDV